MIPVHPAARAVPIASAAKLAAPRAVFALPPRSRVAAITGADRGVLTVAASAFSPRTSTDVPAGQRIEPGPLGQRHDRDQPGPRHDIRVIKTRTGLQRIMRQSHLAGALSIPALEASLTPIVPGQRALSVLPRCSDVPFTRWTEAKHLRPDAPVSWQGLDLDFTGVVFDGGDFSGARFAAGEVYFDGAKFSGGTVAFRDAKFSGGMVDFGGAEFSGCRVDFRGATFSGGRVDFVAAEFSGGTVDVGAAEFSGGEVDFTDAKFSGGEVHFRDAKF